jgi:hypothetical protein
MEWRLITLFLGTFVLECYYGFLNDISANVCVSLPLCANLNKNHWDLKVTLVGFELPDQLGDTDHYTGLQ